MIAIDKMMNFSKSWMRYVTTAQLIQREFEELKGEWLIFEAEVKDIGKCDAKLAKKMINRLKTFQIKTLEIAERETIDWFSEFQVSLAHIEQQIEKYNRKRTVCRQL